MHQEFKYCAVAVLVLNANYLCHSKDVSFWK